MMREKAETIEELSTAILQIQSDQYSASSRAFIELQEKFVADIRSVQIFIIKTLFIDQKIINFGATTL